MKKLCLLLMLVLLLASCGSAQGGQEADASSGSGKKDQSSEGAEAGTASPASLVDPASLSPEAGIFSKKDLKSDYDASSAGKITWDENAQTAGGGMTAEGGRVLITEEGTYILSGSSGNGQVIVEIDKESKVQLVLAGVTLKNPAGPCILVRSADKVIVTLAPGSTNVLSDGGAAYAEDEKVSGVDAVIYAADDLAINGKGSLSVKAGYKHGIFTKNDLTITGGTIDVTAADRGLTGKDSIKIREADITVNAGDDALQTSRLTKAGKGFVYIESGDLTLTSGDDAIHAATALVIAGGTVDIPKCKEGLEGAVIEIRAGEVRIKATDDGINASYETADGESDKVQADTYIGILGGIVSVDANGDGIDANGSIRFAGGSVKVEGSVNDKFDALDPGTEMTADGGTVLAFSAKAPEIPFKDGQAQPFLSETMDQAVPAGTVVTVEDASGAVLISHTAQKEFRHIVFSAPELAPGTYTIRAGNAEKSVRIG
ncbi:MAG: carbohydrate-binding domain-containing protein [Lachnospiraceae bacterium]|nr:carbohydrate-binding domain-containing protein [Lachnospiraceae bacterium]